MVKYKPYSNGKNPVIATPRPRSASANTANVCSLRINSTNTVVKARKPGTSRKLCKMPISTPVKAARSTTKLFNSADQALNATGIATDIKTNNITGRCQVRSFTNPTCANSKGRDSTGFVPQAPTGGL